MKIMKKLTGTMFLLWAVASAAYSQPTDNVAAYYPFNGNANDVTGNEKNGTNIGAVLTSDRLGKANAAYYLDGITNIIELPKTMLPGSNSYAVSMWIRPDGINSSGSGGQFLIDLRGQYRTNVKFFPSNYSRPNCIVFNITNATNAPSITSAQNSVRVNQWNHIVATYSNNLMELYINGKLAGSQVSTPPLAVNAATFNCLGKSLIDNQYWYYGGLDEVIIYKRGLTVAEVLALYNHGLTSGEIAELYNKPDLKYTYDALGRRVSRNAIVLKSALANSNTKETIVSGEATGQVQSFEENLGNQKILIYPNPTKGQLLVEIQGYENEMNSELYLFDLTGRILIRKRPANSTMPLDMTSYPLGTYILKIKLGDKVSEWKIIKE